MSEEGILIDTSAMNTITTALTIQCGKGRVRIGFDGKVELVDCELDEAAKAFWDMVRFYAPKGDK